MRSFFIALLLLCLSSRLHAQPGVIWQKSFGGSNNDAAIDMAKTPDGGYIILGGTTSVDGDLTGRTDTATTDIWVVKMLNDTVQWKRYYGGPGDDRGRSIAVWGSGGYVIAGSTNSSGGDVSGLHGNYDIWVLRLNADGSIASQKTLGGTMHENPGSGGGACMIRQATMAMVHFEGRDIIGPGQQLVA